MMQKQYQPKQLDCLLKGLRFVWIETAMASVQSRISYNPVDKAFYRGYWCNRDNAWNASHTLPGDHFKMPVFTELNWVLIRPLSKEPTLLDFQGNMSVSRTMQFINKARRSQKCDPARRVLWAKKAFKLVVG